MVILKLMLNNYAKAFRLDLPVVVDIVINYKQNIVKHNSVDDFIMCISYIVYFNEMFRL